jgi:hypothetical protein
MAGQYMKIWKLCRYGIIFVTYKTPLGVSPITEVNY